MDMQSSRTSPALPSVSPLMLADNLIRLAEDADRSGMRGPAERLLRLAFAMYDERPRA